MASFSHRLILWRRFIASTGSLLLAASAMTGPTRASAQAIIEDRFDSGLNGWTVYNDGTNLRWDGAAGNPGGCVRADDGAGGTYWGFVASPAYSGDRSCLYGGALAWQVYTSLTSTAGASQPDVAIYGAGLILVYDLTPPAANTWISRVVTLTETAGWRKSSLSGAVPTQAEFRSVLANITAIRFRAEYSTNTDVGRLDNVALGSFLLESPASASVCPAVPVEFTVTITHGTGNGPFTYQWRKGGVAIDAGDNPSAVTPTLSIASAQEQDVGSYDCVVTNACGSGTSLPAILGVCPSDYNCDGGIDGTDVEAFFADWEAGNPRADVSADGGIDGTDVEYFFGRWEAGC